MSETIRVPEMDQRILMPFPPDLFPCQSVCVRIALGFMYILLAGGEGSQSRIQTNRRTKRRRGWPKPVPF